MSPLKLFELGPLLLKTLAVHFCTLFHRLVLEAVKLFLRPKASNIALLGKTSGHLIPRITLILLMEQEQTIDDEHSVLPRLIFAYEKFVLKDFR